MLEGEPRAQLNPSRRLSGDRLTDIARRRHGIHRRNVCVVEPVHGTEVQGSRVLFAGLRLITRLRFPYPV